MTRRFVLRPEAEAELLNAAAWDFERSRRLGAEFLAAVDPAFSAIERAPQQFTEVDPPVRRAVLRRFPYMIMFRATEEEPVDPPSVAVP